LSTNQLGSAGTKAGNAPEEEDERSAGEEETVVMRTEITVAIKDTAQPTVAEIQEFESFSSKDNLTI